MRNGFCGWFSGSIDHCKVLHITGRSIQKPYSKGNEAYFKESESRFEMVNCMKKDSIKVADTLKFKTKKGKIICIRRRRNSA
jgi:hypothetical protein